MKPLLSCFLLPNSITRAGVRCVRKMVGPMQRNKGLMQKEQDGHPHFRNDFSKSSPVLTRNKSPQSLLEMPGVAQGEPFFKSKKKQASLAKQNKPASPTTSAPNFDHIPIAEQVVVMFPGQGAQHLKMGEKVVDNPSSARLFEEASEFLGYNLLDICLKGPKTTLDQTIYCQMAVFVSSMAAVEKLKSQQPALAARITDVAGFSIGEYCALALGGVISFQDALKVIKVRAEAMHECSQIVSSGMMTVRTSAVSKLDQAIAEAKQEAKAKYEWAICDVANYLYCGVKVVGGTNSCLDYLETNSNRLKYQVIKRLPVSGAFHTYLMAPAEQKVEEVLKTIPINLPTINVYSNYSGKLYPRREQKIRKFMVQQISQPVKWEQIVQLLFRKHQDYVFPSYFEVGPGRQLGTILNQVSKKAYNNYVHYPC